MANNTTHFYETTYTIKVLSERPLPEMTLEGIQYEITEGSCVGYDLRSEPKELTRFEMAEALYAAGSDPSFFGLDERAD